MTSSTVINEKWVKLVLKIHCVEFYTPFLDLSFFDTQVMMVNLSTIDNIGMEVFECFKVVLIGAYKYFLILA